MPLNYMRMYLYFSRLYVHEHFQILNNYLINDYNLVLIFLVIVKIHNKYQEISFKLTTFVQTFLDLIFIVIFK